MEYISNRHVTGMLDSYATELTKRYPWFYAYLYQCDRSLETTIDEELNIALLPKFRGNPMLIFG